MQSPRVVEARGPSRTLERTQVMEEDEEQATISQVLTLEQEPEKEKNSSYEGTIYIQGALMVSVVALGCTDVILRQILAKTLTRFSYLIGLATAATYLPVNGMILLVLLRIGLVPWSQLRWAWAGNAGGARGVFFAPVCETIFSLGVGRRSRKWLRLHLHALRRRSSALSAVPMHHDVHRRAVHVFAPQALLACPGRGSHRC